MSTDEVTPSGQGANTAAAQRIENTTDALDQLLALLDEPESLETVLTRLVHSATAVIPDTGSATVSILRRDGTAYTAAGSHAWAVEMDEHQYRDEDGPCLHAARTGRLVRLDTSSNQQWTKFSQSARDNGVAVAFGAPLLLDENLAATAAALNLTAPSQHAFDPLDEALLEVFTHALSAAINHAYRGQRARQLADQLSEGLENRDVIGQAKGLLIARHHCSSETAFDYLRQASQRSHIKLHDVAARVVASETHELP